MNRETDHYDSRSTLSLPQSVTASYQDGDQDPSLAKIYCLILDRSVNRARVVGHHYACPETLFWDTLRLLFLSADNTEENFVRIQSQPTLYNKEKEVAFDEIQQFGIYELVFLNEQINLSYEDIVVSYRSE